MDVVQARNRRSGFFRGRRAMDRLLVVDLRDDQCGEKLYRFLGLSEDLPMVHFKKRKKTKIEKYMKYKYRGLLRRLNQYGFGQI